LSENHHLRDQWQDRKFSPENRSTVDMLQSKLPLIVVVAPWTYILNRQIGDTDSKMWFLTAPIMKSGDTMQAHWQFCHLKGPLLYLGCNSSDSDEIWYGNANFDSQHGHVTKIKISQIQDGGWTPSWKWFFGYISALYCLINAKVEGWSRIACRYCHVIKIANFKNSRWRTAAVLKLVILRYLSRYSADLDENLDVRWCEFWFRGWSREQK